jgi:hypothetical protein
LGMNQRELKTLIKKYNIKLDTEEWICYNTFTIGGKYVKRTNR